VLPPWVGVASFENPNSRLGRIRFSQGRSCGFLADLSLFSCFLRKIRDRRAAIFCYPRRVARFRWHIQVSVLSIGISGSGALTFIIDPGGIRVLSDSYEWIESYFCISLEQRRFLEAGVLPWYLRTLTFRRDPPDPTQAPNFNHSLSLNPPSAAVG
jgi:hypothetical protein